MKEVYDIDNEDTYIFTLTSESSKNEDDLDNADKTLMLLAKWKRRTSTSAHSRTQASGCLHEAERKSCIILKILIPQIVGLNKFKWRTIPV